MKKLKSVYHKLSGKLQIVMLLVVMQSFTLNGYSQQEQQPEETPALIDSAIIEAPDTDMENVDVEVFRDEEKAVNYFIPKSQQESGTDKLNIRHIPESEKQKLYADRDFWYTKSKPGKTARERNYSDQTGSGKPLSEHPLFQTILWVVVIAGFIVFLVIYLRNSNVNLFRRDVKLKSEDDSDVLTDDIYAISYGKEIEQAISNNNFRLATRLLFLRLLRNLADKQIIHYAQDRTNLDYLLQLQKSTVYKDFFRLTRHYEYSWYGQFPVDKSKFDVIRQEFDHFDTKLRQL